MVKHRRTSNLALMDIKGDGIYCIFPFSQLDSKGRGVFKIGIATGGTFHKRLEDVYHTYMPMGFYYKCLLELPTKQNPKGDSKEIYYRRIEHDIINAIKTNGGKGIISGARTNNDQATEWVFCSQKLVEEVFDAAQDLYGGKCSYMTLNKRVFQKLEPKEDEVYFTGIIKFHG
jgi:hypothetical protein